MGYSSMRKAVSVVMAFLLVATCNSASVQPLAAFADSASVPEVAAAGGAAEGELPAADGDVPADAASADKALHADLAVTVRMEGAEGIGADVALQLQRQVRTGDASLQEWGAWSQEWEGFGQPVALVLAASGAAQGAKAAKHVFDALPVQVAGAADGSRPDSQYRYRVLETRAGGAEVAYGSPDADGVLHGAAQVSPTDEGFSAALAYTVELADGPALTPELPDGSVPDAAALSGAEVQVNNIVRIVEAPAEAPSVVAAVGPDLVTTEGVTSATLEKAWVDNNDANRPSKEIAADGTLSVWFSIGDGAETKLDDGTMARLGLSQVPAISESRSGVGNSTYACEGLPAKVDGKDVAYSIEEDAKMALAHG